MSTERKKKMDEIQKILIKAGHKDLAQKYYTKVLGKISSGPGSTGRKT